MVKYGYFRLIGSTNLAYAMTPTDYNLITDNRLKRKKVVFTLGILLFNIVLLPSQGSGYGSNSSIPFESYATHDLNSSIQVTSQHESHTHHNESFSHFTRDEHHHFIRCLTPLLMQYEQDPSSFSDYQQIFEIAGVSGFSKPFNSTEILNRQEYRSESGRFLIRYYTDGRDAVPIEDSNETGIPDYVELAAIYADSSWNYLVGTLGYHDPVPDTTKPITISLRNAGAGLYGYYMANTREIVAHNNFASGFPPNQDVVDGEVLGRLKVTIAHELKHAIQFMYNKISSTSRTDEISSWMELDATMTEEIVFSTVKDYLNYQYSVDDPSIFGNPRASIPYTRRPPQGGVVLGYNQATFGLYYHEVFGETFWSDVWRNTDMLDRFNMWQAIDMAITDRGSVAAEEFMRMYLWHYASGNRSLPDFGFKDRLFYPNLNLSNTDLNRRIPFESSWIPFNSRSAMVYEFEPRPGSDSYDQIHTGLFRTIENLSQRGLVHSAIMIIYSDSTVQMRINSDVNSSYAGSIVTTNLTTTRPWQFIGFNFEPDRARTISKISLVVTNYSSSPNHLAQLVVGHDQQPSSQQFGIVAGNGAPHRAEAEAILDRVVRVPQVPLVNTPLQKVALDVSNNDRLTPYDASLILRKGENKIDFFPADPDLLRFAPLITYYSENSILHSQIEHPNSALIEESDTITLDSDSRTDRNGEQNYTSEIQNTFFVDYNFGRDDEGEPIDNILRVYIRKPQTNPMYSMYLELDVPAELFSFGGFRAQNDSTNTLISQFATENNSFRFAFAGSSPIPTSDTLITLLFQPKLNEDFSFQMALRRVILDETLDTSLNVTLSGDIQINEGVGIRTPDELPISTRLHQSYPNPFNPTTTIPFVVAENSKIKIEVFDLTGRRIQTLTDQQYSPGAYYTKFDAVNLASGVYFIRMTANNTSSNMRQETYFQRISLIK